MRVLVVGAGVGGLAVAAGLRRHGASVDVVEQAAEFAPVGSGLSLFPNGFKALERLGLDAAVRAVCAAEPPSIGSGLRRPDGQWLSKTGPRGMDDVRAIDRAELHAALLGTLDADIIRTGRRVTGVADDAVRFADGTSRSGYHVIVGADGLRSRVRASLPGDPGVRAAGYLAWRAITAEPVEIDGFGETWGRGVRFGLFPLRDGRVYWFASANNSPESAQQNDLAFLSEHFGQWHDPVPRLLATTEPNAIQRLPIEELSRPARRFAVGTVALLGDAAHAMTPNLGQGANQAFEDAAVLTAVLARMAASAEPPIADVLAALTRYDRIRRPRVVPVVRNSRMVGQIGQWSHPLAVTLRDRVIALAPDWFAL